MTWTFANGQTISQLWDGTETQSGSNVTVANMSYNGSVAAGATLSGMGFNGTWNNITNAIPTSFAVNGTTCGGASRLTSTTTTLTSTSSSTTTGTSVSLTAAVSPAAAAGTVTFYDGTTSLGTGTLSSGSATLTTSFSTTGTHSITAVYGGSSTYATSTSSAVSITVSDSSTGAVVTVNPSSEGIAVSDMILGMNLASWYDEITNKTAIVDAFQSAGIKAVRWPGGSWSDIYHWATNANCFSSSDGSPNTNDTFANFVSDIVTPAGLDVSLTANYGTDVACTGGGDLTEAAAWAAKALTLGANVSHITVGNEVYGTWEEDLHTVAHDPTTYASAVASGYYPDIKAVSPNVLVGVVVQPDYTWDTTVLANAKYDFVEFHFYPETPGEENDTTLIQQDPQELTTYINTIKTELATAGHPNTPIYVGEIGGPYSNPGKQSWSITQGLYAGQVLGEMMNDGVSRLTWWIGFGNCNGTAGNDSSSLYGWQDFGAYNVFSDGPDDSTGTCTGAPAIGTMSPTARAFQLFSSVAVKGEYVLTPTVTGDTTDVRAYAATHSGGEALVLFNDNETTSETVQLNLTGVTSSSSVTVETYNKAIYDETESDVWAAPTTTDLGAQSLPLTLTLTPWSMNVIIIQ
ncbi:Ig-like domain repeat protein [Telmatobacter bradus]|uniref:Ig-like domain repeat protein n=1 Tax=Telmatobacter bradus TaxID=474953 RepID=UPI003B43307E